MNKDVEQALFDHVAQKPDMTVDDMLWWLYDNYKLVVGTRTIRRAFERRNTSHKKFRNDARKDLRASGASTSLGDPADENTGDALDPDDDQSDHNEQTQASIHGPALPEPGNPYQSPYAPMEPMSNTGSGPSDISPELARALGGLAQTPDPTIHPDLVPADMELSEDEETLQLQLQQIALQKREIELKLKMRRMQRARRLSQTPRMSTSAENQSYFPDLNVTPGTHNADTTSNALTMPGSTQPRDSRSKSKVEEAKRRTEERQERMLKDLEKRSRRREHLTAEWVQSRDVWAKGPEKLLVSLMHQHQTYAYNQNSLDTFEAIFNALYQLVDHSNWYAPVHDDLLRERTRRKMSQLRSKMVKSGEIVSRGEGYGGWTRSADAPPLSAGGSGADIDDTGMSLEQSMHEMSGMTPLDMSALEDAAVAAAAAAAQGDETQETMMASDAMMHSSSQHHHHHHEQQQQQQQHDLLHQHQHTHPQQQHQQQQQQHLQQSLNPHHHHHHHHLQQQHQQHQPSLHQSHPQALMGGNTHPQMQAAAAAAVAVDFEQHQQDVLVHEQQMAAELSQHGAGAMAL